MSRPRPFALSNAETAELSNASAASPYTVSVGTTTRRPALSAPRAAFNPAARESGLLQSYTVLTHSSFH